MTEAEIQSLGMLAASEAGHRLLRNNVGAYKDGRGVWIRYGVGGTGGSDAIGWATVEITPDMVGQKIAVFAAVEFKTPTGRVKPEQQQWLASVKRGGGISGIARSADDVVRILNGAE